MRTYSVDYSRYSFKEDDDWGTYVEGEKRVTFNPDGYANYWYKCDDGKYHKMCEHVAKWEFFNGKIPDGYEIDHIIPIREGGTNKLSNLRVVTHKENCNNPQTRRYNSEIRKGFKLSEEVKRKIADAHKGKKCPKRYKKVFQYTLDGKFINEYKNVKEASISTGCSISTIRYVCLGKFKTGKGFIWRYEKKNGNRTN